MTEESCGGQDSSSKIEEGEQERRGEGFIPHGPTAMHLPQANPLRPHSAPDALR